MRISKTLFLKTLLDLVGIFALSLVALSLLFSFGGLLKPVTRYGLGPGQVGELLLYLVPAMQAYTLPVAALMATTLVYGRLSADNELTGLRAAGISDRVLILPAAALGIVLCGLAYLTLATAVPYFTLQVERIAFSDMARLVEWNIRRESMVDVGGVGVYADGAETIRSAGLPEGAQAVQLRGPTFVQLQRDPNNPEIRAASEFWTARSAVAMIRHDDRGLEFTATLDDGYRITAGPGATVRIGQAQFGPIRMESPVRENAKFMSDHDLQRLQQEPRRSRRVRDKLQSLVQKLQDRRMLEEVESSLRDSGSIRWANAGESLDLRLPKGSRIENQPGQIIVAAAPQAGPITLVRAIGKTLSFDEARWAIIRSEVYDGATIRLWVELRDAKVSVGETQSARESFIRSLIVPTPKTVASLADLPPGELIAMAPGTPEAQGAKLLLAEMDAEIRVERHSRGSFAVSCIILLPLGALLGMAFRSGNFLSSFGLSVVPALLIITLITAGRNVALKDPTGLDMGLALIWSGNLLVLFPAVFLYAKVLRGWSVR